MRNIRQETSGARTVTEITEIGPRTVQFPLSGGTVFTMSVNQPVSRSDFKRIQKLIDLSEESFCDKGKIGFTLPAEADTL